MKKNLNLFFFLLLSSFALVYISCSESDTSEGKLVNYDLTVSEEREAYLSEIKSSLVDNGYEVQGPITTRNHHCPPEISTNGECETFTAPIQVPLDLDFTGPNGLPFNPNCFFTITTTVTLCVTPAGVEVSFSTGGGSISSADCPELFQIPFQQWVIPAFNYARANVDNVFFDSWIGNQMQRFDCNNGVSYVLESESWSSKCSGTCVFFDEESPEIRFKEVDCGDGCCATVTTWCWNSTTGEIETTPGVPISIDGDCTNTPTEECDGFLFGCRESEACN